jgi:S-formylglutathione hydrolase FrmB
MFFRLTVLFISALSFARADAAIVDTADIYSESMKKHIDCVVIRPRIIQPESGGLPVVYLLHGHGGGFSNWIKRVPELKKYADEYNLIIVCPDGHASSWYFDSPIDASMKYETYVSIEVPAYIDAHYPTVKNRNGRAITGLSMGGHGGLFLGFRNAHTFGACGSMSGAVDIGSKSLRNPVDIIQRIGDTVKYADNWKSYSVYNIVETYPKDSLAIIIDCGTEDFLYSDNRALHEKMVRLKIPHDYIERPGKHDWPYWSNAVRYQLLFFRIYFDRYKDVK